MLYLFHALGGLGRSVTDTARHALAGANGAPRWRKLALYVAMFVLPGGLVAVLLFAWADRRRALRRAAGAGAGAKSAAGAQPCTGGQPACRGACAAPRVQPPSAVTTRNRRPRAR